MGEVSEEGGIFQPPPPLPPPMKIEFLVVTDLVPKSGSHPAAILLAVHEDGGGSLRAEPGTTWNMKLHNINTS